jgi:transcriptional regulator of NAD metabolism
MIATAIKLQEASRDAVHDDMIIEIVKHIVSIRNEVDDESFIKEMFNYSAMLSAMTTTLVTHALLTEEQLNDMMDTIKEMDTVGEELLNEYRNN